MLGCTVASAAPFEFWAQSKATIDVLDMDIQGEEYDVLFDIQHTINSKVLLLIIGTHSPLLHSDIRALFSHWTVLEDSPHVGAGQPSSMVTVLYGSNPPI